MGILNIRLIGGPCDGRVITLIVNPDEPRRDIPYGICFTEVVYEPSGYFEPLTGYEHFRWKKTTHHGSNAHADARTASARRVRRDVGNSGGEA